MSWERAWDGTNGLSPVATRARASPKAGPGLLEKELENSNRKFPFMQFA